MTADEETRPVTQIEFSMTIAELSVAEEAFRDEPYERLPYLSGTLAVAASRMMRLRNELYDAHGKIKNLEDLLGHVWIHAGYKNCGYEQMTTVQKELFDRVVGKTRT